MMQIKKIFTPTSALAAYFVWLAISLAVSSTMASAKDYYVAKTGNDANIGTAAAPFLTIKKGMLSMGAGDTLLIRAGTYTDRLRSYDFTFPTGSSWANAPLIKAFPGEVVMIQPNGGASGIDLADPYVQYMIFEGLIFDGSFLMHDISSVISLTNGANHVRFLNIEARNSPVNVVLITEGASGGTWHNEFLGGNYHHSDIFIDPHPQNNGAYIFYISASHNLFDGIDIHHATGYGIRTWNTPLPHPDFNIIRNCRIHDNNLLTPGGSGLLLGSGKGNIAYNNLIYDNLGDGVQIQGGATGSMLYNNTIYNNKQEGIDVGDRWHTTTGSLIKNNIVYKSGTVNFREPYINKDPGSAGTILSNNLMGIDPLFVDAANHDFHLSADSPAINKGATLPEVPVGFEQNPRPQGAAYDIGALEFNQSTVGRPTNLQILSSR